MSCDINKTSSEYTKDLDTEDLQILNTCIQKSIDYKLNNLVTRDESNYIKNEKKDSLTFSSMNNNTLAIYTHNFYYIIFKLSIFLFIIGSYFLLSK
jgi:hypothetical protein|tara:strand:+ start:265 stop:552 length:288 start_codon:yes stop_codon:yes gene_type:complete